MKKGMIILFGIIMFFFASIEPVYATNQVANTTNTTSSTTCSSLFGKPTVKGTPAYYMVLVFNYMKYIAIIILVVMSIFDFIGAITSGKDDAINTALKKIGTRCLLCIILFILPTLLKVGLGLIDKRAANMCGIGGVE